MFVSKVVSTSGVSGRFNLRGEPSGSISDTSLKNLGAPSIKSISPPSTPTIEFAWLIISCTSLGPAETRSVSGIDSRARSKIRARCRDSRLGISLISIGAHSEISRPEINSNLARKPAVTISS